VLVASDRVYYNRMKASRAVAGSAVEFPAHTSERRVRLVGKAMRIGRRSAARDLVPEIDLADQPVDPGGPYLSVGRHLVHQRPRIGQRHLRQQPRARHRGKGHPARR
jgi:hypothetical protein